jgi:type IV pilus assembly protein PilY1
MRARLKDIGPTMINSGNPGVTNPRTEFSATNGTYVANPDSSDAAASGVSQSGVINYLNKFGKASAGYKRTDTISEMYYESLRYLKNMGSATPQYVAGLTNAMKDGFPVITTWDDPVQYSCQKNYTVMIADVNAWCDWALPGTSINESWTGMSDRCTGHVAGISNPISGLNVSTQVDAVAKLENLPGASTLADKFADSNPSPFQSGGATSGRKNTWYIAGLAYWANTNDLRPDKTAGTSDRVTVQTYTVDVAETGSWSVPDASGNNINQLWLAAKYGGFEDINLDGTPANQQTWDENGDGIPDNYFLASRPDVLAKSLNDVFTSILSKGTAAAAVAVSNANVTSIDRASFSTSFNSGTWSGDLQSFPIDLVTGLPSTTRTWSAKALVDALADPVNSRRIVTHKDTGSLGPGGNGIPFRNANLSSTQRGLLVTPSVPLVDDSADVIAFLRGDRTKEGGAYRVRASRLADFVNAEPVFVGKPTQRYIDNGYSAFASSKAGRAKMVYQGGNGGMLHAFNADTGKEEWAYVPNLVMGSLNNLSRRQGFTHRYYVDGTPLAADVDFNKTESGSGSPDWRTILVGGLGKGGRGYYALDITDPIPADESMATTKVLWEFPNSSISSTDAKNVGFTYGRPVIVKTKAKGWVAIVTSGYNNGTDPGGSGGDGRGHIYVLDARNGKLIKDLSTGAGTATDPSGLAKISAFVDASDVDNTIKYLYGGDLKGNLWRVDFTGNNATQWDVKKLATLVDAGGSFQPITTEPELGEVDGKPLVMVGTGQLFGDSDIPGAVGANAHATQTQTMYGIQDDLSASPTVTSLRTQLVQQILTVDALNQNRTLTSNAVDYTTKRGWYVDLPDTGERSNTDPALALGVLIFTTNIPNSDPCSPGGKSFFYTIDYKTGGKLDFTGAPAYSGLFAGNALASRPTVIKLPNGTIRAIVRMSDSTNIAPEVPVSPSLTSARRINWKEVLEK